MQTGSEQLEGVGGSSLDYLKNNRNRFCGRYSVAGPVQRDGAQVWRHSRLKCKAWNCPVCGPKRARQLRRAVIANAHEWELCRLLTLTLDPKNCPVNESVPYIKECWNKFRTYLKRKYKGHITFIWVLELQKNGYAHLHVLVDRYMSQKWVSQAWQAVGGGQIVDLRQVQMERVAGYLSKYLTKELALGDFGRGQRRYGSSRDIKLFSKPAVTGWRMIRAKLEYLVNETRGPILAVGFNSEGELDSFETENMDSRFIKKE